MLGRWTPTRTATQLPGIWNHTRFDFMGHKTLFQHLWFRTRLMASRKHLAGKMFARSLDHQHRRAAESSRHSTVHSRFAVHLDNR